MVAPASKTFNFSRHNTHVITLGGGLADRSPDGHLEVEEHCFRRGRVHNALHMDPLQSLDELGAGLLEVDILVHAHAHDGQHGGHASLALQVPQALRDHVTNVRPRATNAAVSQRRWLCDKDRLATGHESIAENLVGQAKAGAQVRRRFHAQFLPGEREARWMDNVRRGERLRVRLHFRQLAPAVGDGPIARHCEKKFLCKLLLLCGGCVPVVQVGEGAASDRQTSGDHVKEFIHGCLSHSNLLHEWGQL